jgi:hypothetical protein
MGVGECDVTKLEAGADVGSADSEPTALAAGSVTVSVPVEEALLVGDAIALDE